MCQLVIGIESAYRDRVWADRTASYCWDFCLQPFLEGCVEKHRKDWFLDEMVYNDNIYMRLNTDYSLISLKWSIEKRARVLFFSDCAPCRRNFLKINNYNKSQNPIRKSVHNWCEDMWGQYFTWQRKCQLFNAYCVSDILSMRRCAKERRNEG